MLEINFLKVMNFRRNVMRENIMELRGLLISKNSYIEPEDNLLDISKNREKSDQIKIINDFSGCNIQEEIEKEKGKYKALVFIGCSFKPCYIKVKFNLLNPAHAGFNIVTNLKEYKNPLNLLIFIPRAQVLVSM